MGKEEKQKNKKKLNKKYKEINTTRKKNKGGMKQTLFFLFLGCWPFSGQNPARDKGQTTI